LEVVRYIIVAFVLLIPIGFWSRAHWRDIQALAKVTENFGAGQLSARASTPAAASIYPLAQQINQMANRIETLLSSQQHLLHSVSHELRTPIARLEFALEILQSGLGSSDINGKQTQRIIAMQGDLSELNSLVSELLDSAKLDAQGQLQRETIVLEMFIQNCLQHLPPKPQGLDLQVECAATNKSLFVDQRLLSRAIQNLLKNAYKYADQKIIWRLKTQGEHWLISVEDDGAGIPASEREKIFDAFYRLDRSRDRATGGFGLGLSIVRQIIVLHGGRIHISESELGGAKFEISLPVVA
jgi:two-component system OmpR family sensor kinase